MRDLRTLPAWTAAMALVVVLVVVSGCDSGSESVEDMYRTCALVSACMGLDEATSFGQECDLLYVLQHGTSRDQGTDYRLFAALFGCVERAADCEAVRACVQADAAQQAQCAGHEGDEICVGGTSASIASIDRDSNVLVLDRDIAWRTPATINYEFCKCFSTYRSPHRYGPGRRPARSHPRRCIIRRRFRLHGFDLSPGPGIWIAARC